MQQVTHEQLGERLDQGDQRFANIERKLDDLAKDVSATRDLLEAMAAVKSVARFIKWSGGIAAAIVAFWALAKAIARGLQ